MTELRWKRSVMRVLVGLFLAAAMLAVLVPFDLKDPERALQSAVAGALAADDRLLEVALEQYPEQGPAIVITYGHLDLFREQLERFGPQVIPIVAAYQSSFTTADALQLAREAWLAFLEALGAPTADSPRTLGQSKESAKSPTADGPRILGQAGESGKSSAADGPRILRQAGDPAKEQVAGDARYLEHAPLTPEERGLIALLKMQDEGNAFVGQLEITAGGEARRVPSRLVTLAGPEILIGGLTALERRIVQEREIDWQTYGLAAVDIAAIASGVALLRFAKTAARGMNATRTAARAATLRSGVLASAEVLGINAVKFGLPIGLVVLMVLHPGVFTHYLWILAESLGIPGVIGPIIGWGIVLVPLAFFLCWMLLSVRMLRFAGWVFAGVARGCQHLAYRPAVADDR